MASWHDVGEAPPLAAGADLSSAQYKVVKQSSQTYVLATAATDKFNGVLQNKPTAGLPCLVYNRGKVPVLAGASVSVGDLVTVDSTSRVVATTTAGNHVLGIAKTGGAVGEVIEVNVDFSRVPA
jgi:hypothetical protein